MADPQSRRSTSSSLSPTKAPSTAKPPAPGALREQILQHFQTLKVPLTAEQLDAALSRAEREGLSHLAFVHHLLAEQAAQRRERSIAYRIQQARFRDAGTLESFDWKFNAAAIERSRFEELAGVDFDKGCYVGQEVTARMKHRALVRKRLVPVAIEGPPPAVRSILVDPTR